MPSITSLNAKLTITAASVFNAPQTIQQFAVDDIYDVDVKEVAETMMGVDGFLSAGLVKMAVTQNITLMASSPSGWIFDQIIEKQFSAGDVVQIQGTLSLQSLLMQWTQTNGYIRSYTPIPAGKRVLQPRRFTLVWESVTRNNITSVVQT